MDHLFLHLIIVPLFQWLKCVLTTMTTILSKLDFYASLSFNKYLFCSVLRKLAKQSPARRFSPTVSPNKRRRRKRTFSQRFDDAGADVIVDRREKNFSSSVGKQIRSKQQTRLTVFYWKMERIWDRIHNTSFSS